MQKTVTSSITFPPEKPETVSSTPVKTKVLRYSNIKEFSELDSKSKVLRPSIVTSNYTDTPSEHRDVSLVSCNQILKKSVTI
jgi:hypothetical protein